MKICSSVEGRFERETSYRDGWLLEDARFFKNAFRRRSGDAERLVSQAGDSAMEMELMGC